MPELQHGFLVEEHLGGYIPGGDPATIYPDLWNWFVDELGVRSVLDIGCGEGWALRHFRERGCRVLGLDGIAQEDPDITCWDYTRGAACLLGEFDLVWCCEFVEHVEERFVPHFLPDFARGSYVAMTHATPGQPGWHHVNNQPAAYWRGALAAMGLRYDAALTAAARGKAALNLHPHNHFVRSGMVFRSMAPPTKE